MKKYLLILLIFKLVAGHSQNLSDSLIAFYPFTGNALDSSGNGNNGVINGAKLTTDRFGKSNSAYLFDGNDEIRIKKPFKGKQPFSSNATICYWIKTSTIKQAAAILTLHSACSNNSNDLMTFYLNNTGSNHHLFNTIYWASPILKIDEKEVTDNIWHFVCYSYNNDSAILYLDGVKVDQSLVAPEPGFYFDTNTDLTIGNIGSTACGYDFFFEGAIDDIRLYNRTLSQSEITKINNNSLNTNSVTLNKLPYLFPNPCLDILTISNLNSDISSIEITDMTGQLILNKKNDVSTSMTIDLFSFSIGFYYVIFRNTKNELLGARKLMICR